MRIIRIPCDAPAEVPARALTEFLYDLNMIYERLVILTEGEVDESWYSSNFYRRTRRLARAKELKIGRIIKESPLQIEVVIELFFLASLFLTVLVRINKEWREARLIEAKTRRVEAETELVQAKTQLVQAKRRQVEAITQRVLAEVNELTREGGGRSISPETLEPLKKDLRKLLANRTIGISNVEQITSEDKPKQKAGDEK
jgi:hypothetical protein